MKRTSLAIFAALLCASAPFVIGSASAQQSGATSPASKLDAFVGDGVCTGNVMATGKTPGHASTGKYHGERTLDGHWVVIRYDEDRNADNPRPFSVVEYFGYDSTKRQYLSVLVANSDGAYGTGVSPGWKGDSITFDQADPPGSAHVAYRDTFTKGAAGIPSHTGTMKDKRGKWVKTDEETCHKA